MADKKSVDELLAEARHINEIVRLKRRIRQLEREDILAELLAEYGPDPALAKIAARMRAEQYANPVPEQHTADSNHNTL